MPYGYNFYKKEQGNQSADQVKICRLEFISLYFMFMVARFSRMRMDSATLTLYVFVSWYNILKPSIMEASGFFLCVSR